MSRRRQEALDYHSRDRPGKIEVVPTKSLATQHELALAYSPGVAEPCREIEKDPGGSRGLVLPDLLPPGYGAWSRV